MNRPSRNALRHPARHALGLLGLCILAGCTSKGEGNPAQGPGRDPEAVRAEDRPSGVWFPIPSEARVFPTTRLVTEADRPLLEARIELRDQMGHPLKSSGTFRFELFAAPPGTLRAGQQLYSWSTRLSSAEQQREHFDPVTGAYRFQLQLGDTALTERRTLLRVTFTPPVGPRLTALYVLGG